MNKDKNVFTILSLLADQEQATTTIVATGVPDGFDPFAGLKELSFQTDMEAGAEPAVCDGVPPITRLASPEETRVSTLLERFRGKRDSAASGYWSVFSDTQHTTL